MLTTWYMLSWRTSIVLTLLLLVFFFSAVSVSADDRVLLIGVGSYGNSNRNIPDLPGIQLDIERMKGVGNLLGYDPAQIKVLRDQQATLNAVEKEIVSWLGQAGPQDRVLLYFSGHGTRIFDESGDEADGADEALCLYDLEPVKKNGRRSLAGILTDDRFHELVSGLKSKKILIVLDHCHSGSSTKGLDFGLGDRGQYVSKFFSYDEMPLNGDSFFSHTYEKSLFSSRPVVFSSCRDDEESVTTEKGSLFTEGIYKGLSEKHGKQTVDTLYLQKYTTDFIRAQLGEAERYRWYHPQLQGNMIFESRSK